MFRRGEHGLHRFFKRARKEGLGKSKDPSRLDQGRVGASGLICHRLEEQHALFDGARTPEMPLRAFVVQLILRDFARRLGLAPPPLPGFRDPGADPTGSSGSCRVAFKPALACHSRLCSCFMQGPLGKREGLPLLLDSLIGR